ncbi:hypothetical protein ACNKHX_26175 [Shigella flexneri]
MRRWSGAAGDLLRTGRTGGYADRSSSCAIRKQVAEIPLAELSVPAIMNAIAA